MSDIMDQKVSVPHATKEPEKRYTLNEILQNGNRRARRNQIAHLKRLERQGKITLKRQ